jgi:hypothetical protein
VTTRKSCKHGVTSQAPMGKCSAYLLLFRGFVRCIGRALEYGPRKLAAICNAHATLSRRACPETPRGGSLRMRSGASGHSSFLTAQSCGATFQQSVSPPLTCLFHAQHRRLVLHVLPYHLLYRHVLLRGLYQRVRRFFPCRKRYPQVAGSSSLLGRQWRE